MLTLGKRPTPLLTWSSLLVVATHPPGNNCTPDTINRQCQTQRLASLTRRSVITTNKGSRAAAWVERVGADHVNHGRFHRKKQSDQNQVTFRWRKFKLKKWLSTRSLVKPRSLLCKTFTYQLLCIYQKCVDHGWKNILTVSLSNLFVRNERKINRIPLPTFFGSSSFVDAAADGG